MTLCPHCGQMRREVSLGADALHRILKTGHPHREVYRAQSGDWFVTYGGGETRWEAVKELLNRGLIRSVYSDCPNDVYHIGSTIDVAATLAARKGKPRSDWQLIYAQESEETNG